MVIIDGQIRTNDQGEVKSNVHIKGPGNNNENSNLFIGFKSISEFLLHQIKRPTEHWISKPWKEREKGP